MGPSGVCLSKDEKFALIADPLSFQVRKLNLKTLELSTFLGTGKRGRTTEPANARKVNLSGPTAVTRDENGTIFVIDNSLKKKRAIIRQVYLPDEYSQAIERKRAAQAAWVLRTQGLTTTKKYEASLEFSVDKKTATSNDGSVHVSIFLARTMHQFNAMAGSPSKYRTSKIKVYFLQLSGQC
eukprot:m.306219 g.306219  ORF g.306219 m.306219 type:complete len:182 (+) comp16344_c1_seq24:893-1438(+)